MHCGCSTCIYLQTINAFLFNLPDFGFAVSFTGSCLAVCAVKRAASFRGRRAPSPGPPLSCVSWQVARRRSWEYSSTCSWSPSAITAKVGRVCGRNGKEHKISFLRLQENIDTHFTSSSKTHSGQSKREVRVNQYSTHLLRFLPGSGAASDSRDGRGRRSAAGPSAQPAEHHQRGDSQTGPPHPHLPAQSAADPAVCHGLGVHHPRQ